MNEGNGSDHVRNILPLQKNCGLLKTESSKAINLSDHPSKL